MAFKPLETLTASVKSRSKHPSLAVLAQNIRQQATPPPDTERPIHYFSTLSNIASIANAGSTYDAMVQQVRDLQRAYENWYQALMDRYEGIRQGLSNLLYRGENSWNDAVYRGGDFFRKLSAPSHITSILERASQLSGVPVHILTAVARAESGFRPYVVSPAGAIGLMQLMPGTARALGVNPWDPVQNAIGGARYLAQQLQRFGDLRLALAAYNAGPGRVSRAIQKAGSRDWSAIARYLPRETRNYVARIMGWLQ